MPFMRSGLSNSAPKRIYLALGANQSYRRAAPVENLKSAICAMHAVGITVVRCSRPWRTPAWPDPSDPPFVNAMAEVRTHLTPKHLMAQLHEIEIDMGRKRSYRNAPRTLDLDLIDFRGAIVTPECEGGLELPHPRAEHRAFVLLPMRDIAPKWRHPVSGLALDKLISRIPWRDRKHCRPQGGVLCAAAPRLKPVRT